jgi:hypothetical protein
MGEEPNDNAAQHRLPFCDKFTPGTAAPAEFSASDQMLRLQHQSDFQRPQST